MIRDIFWIEIKSVKVCFKSIQFFTPIIWQVFLSKPGKVSKSNPANL